MAPSHKPPNPPYLLLIRYREIGLVLVIALIVLGVGMRNPTFMGVPKLLFMIEDSAIIAVLAAGMLCVMLVGSIDISVSGIMAVSASVVCILMRNYQTSTQTTSIVNGSEIVNTLRVSYPLLPLLVLGMGVGCACGLVNGLIIAYGGVVPIIATLGMQYVYYGVAHIIYQGTAVYKKDMSSAFYAFTRSAFLGLNMKTVIMLTVYALMFLYLTYQRSGRHLYAVGSSRQACEMRGIPVRRTELTAHMLMGTLAGLAGLMYASYNGKGTQDLASGYELYVIASCVIGGVSVVGGAGRIWCVLLGSITMGVINNALTMMKLTGNAEFWKKAIQGGLILVAILSNVWMQRSLWRRELSRRII